MFGFFDVFVYCFFVVCSSCFPFFYLILYDRYREVHEIMNQVSTDFKFIQLIIFWTHQTKTFVTKTVLIQYVYLSGIYVLSSMLFFNSDFDNHNFRST